MMSKWGLLHNLNEQTAHIIPMDDLKEHEHGCTCWCHPEKDEDYEDLYVHKSMDGREAFESGERQPS
jgi:hypothetical protein